MKKFLHVLTAAVGVILCIFGLVACDNDEDEVVDVTGITLDETEITLTEGEEFTLTATLTPSNATDRTINWSTSNIGVATVDDSGNVVAVEEGETIITAVAATNGLSATCTVTVEAEENNTQYTVTFHAKGGEFEDGKDTYEMQITHGEKLSGNVSVTRDEYVFTNWYKNESRTQLWDFNKDTVTTDIELFAGWKFLNKYQSVIDALTERMKSERQDNSAEVEIISLFTDDFDGTLCFVEKDSTGVFMYKTDIFDFDEILGNDELISQISDAALGQRNAYNDKYTSDNNVYVADNMAYRYTPAASAGDISIIYSCVSEWEIYPDYADGSWYACRINAIVVDEDGNVYDCSVTVVAEINDFDKVLGGSALSEAVGLVSTKFGEPAYDFHLEYYKTILA